MRTTLIGVGALVVAVSLSGCDYFPPERMGFQIVGGDLVVAVCESIDATSMVMELYTAEGEATRFYEVTGEVSIAKGDEFSTAADAATPPEASVRFTPELIPGSEIYVNVRNARDDVISFITIGETGIPTDGWLQPDGTISEWPCGYKR